jgi:uncharacterized protein YydD (DUF2326 family)
MKLARLYANQPAQFSPITFNGVTDDRLSVVFAKITKPKDKTKDSHNLGKTTLIHLIDFLLLKSISGDANHFLAKHADRFKGFTFYLELQTHDGKYVTVRRNVAQPTKISLKQHDQRGLDGTTVGQTQWDHFEVAIDKAREILDAYLNLSVIKPDDYRKGVSYFLRTQADYQDYFQIAKFMAGKDVYWKPYLTQLIGFDRTPVDKKFELDQQIDNKQRERTEKQAEVSVNENDFTKLKAQIAIQHDEVAKTGAQLELFDFRKEEERVNRTLIDQIEQQSADANDQIYALEYDLSQMRQSLSTGVSFDLKNIKQIFEEAQLYFPDNLAHDYNDLVTFNKKVTKERNALLKQQITALEKQLVDLKTEADRLNQERVRYLEILRNADTFKKFKSLQKEFAQQQAHLNYLEQLRDRLAKVLDISKALTALELERKQVIQDTKTAIDEGSETCNTIAKEFHALVKTVLNLKGSFYPAVNTNGNIDFKIQVELLDQEGQATSQAEGTSYKKLLCALFDIAMLRTYATKPFYHFVYHDGIFEGLDKRKRRMLLDVLRDTASKFHIQYILSVIDDDLPRDENDQKIPFPDDEIVLELHDGGANGRLFKMKEF